MKIFYFLVSFFALSFFSQAQCVEPYPYSEDFENANFVQPNSAVGIGSLPTCWSRIPTTTDVWVVGPPFTTVALTGPIGDHTTGTGKYLCRDVIGSFSSPTSATITTPYYSLVGATNPEFSFWFHLYGSEITAFNVEINKGNGWTNLLTKNEVQTSSAAPWQKETISLSSYVGDTIQFRFTGVRNGFQGRSRISIDDFEIKEASTCAIPTNFYLTGNTATSTNVGWTNVAGNTYLIEYGLYGFTPGTGTTIVATNNPQLVTGLNGSTTYEFYLRTICPVNDTSEYVGPNITNTTCAGPLIAPFTETFDSPKWVPYQAFNAPGNMAPCWARSVNVNDFNWRVNPNGQNTFNSGPLADHTSGQGQYIGMQRITGTTDEAILRSPSIDLSGVSYPELSFWYHMYSAQIDKLEVQVKAVSSASFVTVLTLTGQQQTSSSDVWKKKTISLNAYTNDTIYVRLKGTSTTTFATSAKISIDDLSIQQGSSCPAPSNLTVTSTAPTEIGLSWFGNGNFEIKYGTPGFDPNTTGTSVFVSTNSHTISGLAIGTDYEFYVRANCANSINSSWDGPIQAKTNCLVSAPYNQNFDGNTWAPFTSFNGVGTIDDCWSSSAPVLFAWDVGPALFNSFQTGPAVDHTTGSGQFIFSKRINGFGAPLTNEATILSEYIDLAALSIPEISFWYHMYGNEMGTLYLDIDNGSGWTNVFTIAGQQQSSKAANWKEAIVNLSSYANDTIQLRFRSVKSGSAFNAEIGIDDVDIHELPSCPKPSNVVPTAITFNSVSLSWTTGGATNWIIKQQIVGSSTATYMPTNTNPHNITGLQSSTSYDFWVKDSCALGDASIWFGPIRVRTFCAPVTAPFIEDFDGANYTAWSFTDQNGEMDPCFLRTDTTDYYWNIGPGQNSTYQTGPDVDASGTGKFMYTKLNNFQGNLSTAMVTPWIDASALTAPELRFKYHTYGINIDKIEVVLKGFDGSIQTLKTLTGQAQNSGTAAWLQETIPLTNLSSDTVQIVFFGYRISSGFRVELAVDEIELANPQDCDDPTAVATTNATSTSIDISWTSAASGVASNIEYGAPGFIPGSGTTIHNVTSPYMVTGLSPATPYDFYVIDSCAWGGLSAAVGPENDTTLACTSVTAGGAMSSATGLLVNFDASTSVGTIDTYDWDFGDGNFGTGVTTNHTYAAGGSYFVTLIVSNGCGNSDTLTFAATVCDILSGQFTETINALNITLDGTTSVGTVLNYDWLFGDGNTGTGANTTHTYAADGIYNVSLIVTDACGNVDTLTQQYTVCGPLSPTIVYTQTGLTVSFDGTVVVGATDWQWSFGDGNSASGDSVANTYAATGVYQVTLTVTNICGETETVTIIIDLCNPPTAIWSYTILSSGGGGMTVQFDGSNSIGANAYIWDFGDGNSNTVSAVPVHTYGVPGLFYIVSLTVTNDCGDENIMTSSLAAIGIEDFEKVGMSIFPNPVDDFLMLQIPEFLTVNSLKLVAIDGKTLNVPQVENGQSMVLNTTNLAVGTYFLHVKTNAGNAVYQLVVKH